MEHGLQPQHTERGHHPGPEDHGHTVVEYHADMGAQLLGVSLHGYAGSRYRRECYRDLDCNR